MRIGVIGGGAIGLLISAYLASKHHLTVYTKREDQKQKINKHGIYLDGDQCRKKVHVSLISEIQQEDCLIVCVKQSHIASILPFIEQVEQENLTAMLALTELHMQLLALQGGGNND